MSFSLRFQNFLAANRKATLISFGIFPSTWAAQIDQWIEGPGGSGGFTTVSLTVTPAPDGVTTVFTMSSAPSGGAAFVFLDGQKQVVVTDYAISGVTLTFTVAPADGSKIEVFAGS